MGLIYGVWAIKLTPFCVSGNYNSAAARSRETEPGPEHSKDREALRVTN
jgi:hypothetical protein